MKLVFYVFFVIFVLSILFNLAVWFFTFLAAHWLIFSIGCVLSLVFFNRDKKSHSLPTPRSVQPQTQRKKPDAPFYAIHDVEDGQKSGEDAALSPVVPEARVRRARNKGLAGEIIVNRYIGQCKRPKKEYLWDLFVEYDTHGERRVTQIDHLVRVPWGILVIETKYYGGELLQDAHDPGKWIQILDGAGSRRKLRFNSPTLQNEVHVRAVKAVTGLETNVFNVVVLAGRATRDRSIENSTVRPSMLRDCFASSGRPDDAPYIDTAALNRAWSVLVDLVDEKEALRVKHETQLGYTRN